MMNVGLNERQQELGKVLAEIDRVQEWIVSVNKSIEFAEKFGFAQSIKEVHQPTKDRLLAEYAELVQRERELSNPL